jgi:sugar lactone lactonase YvrE
MCQVTLTIPNGASGKVCFASQASGGTNALHYVQQNALVSALTTRSTITDFASGLTRAQHCISDNANKRLYVVDSDGSGTVYMYDLEAGTSHTYATGVGAAQGIALGPSAGDLYVVGVNSIYLITANSLTSGVLSTLASVGGAGVARDPSNGNLFVTSGGGVLKVTSAGAVTQFVTGLNVPHGIGLDPSTGTLYVAEVNSASLKAITSAGVVSTLETGYFDYPQAVVVDSANEVLYVTDLALNLVVQVSFTGQATGVAAGLAFPRGLALDTNTGAFYVAETLSGKIRKVVVA